ncbi:MAG TPA: Mrp/NBP35 family ATP-binding protein [Acidimicrobiales bacterium]|nr:Mrp/NBP35 family ATP-binding protein [Acidimicrobiales bacterium]
MSRAISIDAVADEAQAPPIADGSTAPDRTAPGSTAANSAASDGGAPEEQTVRTALAGVVDPELGADIVELGMVRRVEVSPKGAVEVELALTVAACPLRTQLRSDVETRLVSVPGVRSVKVVMGEMTGPERAAVMDSARRRAQEERALAVDVPVSTRVLAVSSGKGGVGKSSVTVNLAVALARRGLVVGLLDADIWGFSVPRLLGMHGELRAEADEQAKKIVPMQQPVGSGTLKVVSMGFLAKEEEAIMWRGLILNRAVQHFLEDVRWGALDYLLIDMPPGTGDVQMGLARMLPRTEVLVVTTPPVAAQKVAARAADMARKGHLRVAGVVENMGPFECEHGTRYSLFGQGGGARLSADLGVPLVGTVPLHPDMAEASDTGVPVALGDGPLAGAFDELARRVTDDIAPVVEASGCTARLLDRVEQAIDAAGA